MTRLDISIALAQPELDMSDHSYLLTLTIFDNDLNIFMTKSTEFDPDTLMRFEKESGKWLDLPISLEIPPLELESSYAVEIRGGRVPGRAVLRRPVSIEDLSGGHLSLSDIRLALRDDSGRCTGILDPIPSYATGSSLCVSWETYSLRADDGNMTHTRTTWSVIPADIGTGPSSAWEWIKASVRAEDAEGRVYISNSLEQRGPDRDPSNALVIDIGSLEPGGYLLRLEVEDMVSGFRMERERQFDLVPRKGS
jgi:hypothetical protein